MSTTEKNSSIWNTLTGAGGLALLACTACCIPLLAPLVAWAGIAVAGFLSPYGWIAAIASAGIGVVLFRLRRKGRCEPKETGGCAAGCGKAVSEAEGDGLD